MAEPDPPPRVTFQVVTDDTAVEDEVGDTLGDFDTSVISSAYLKTASTTTRLRRFSNTGDGSQTPTHSPEHTPDSLEDPPAPAPIQISGWDTGWDQPIPGPSVPASAVPSTTASVVDLEALPALSPTYGATYPPLNSATEIAETERLLRPLPPVEGKAAWTFLAAATLIECMVFGLPYSMGVLQSYWAHQMFAGQESTLALASSLPNALLTFASALLGPLIAAMPWNEKRIQMFGLAVATVGLVTSAFVTEAWQLVITFGILYPFSAAVYFPCPLNVFEWFHTRRGLASGIMFMGTGVGGAIFPFLMTAMLNRVGYKVTIILIALLFTVVTSFGLIFVGRRIPVPRPKKHDTPDTNTEPGRRSRWRVGQWANIDWSFMRERSAYVAFTVIGLSSFGQFIPLLWMPTYATAVNATKPDGTALVSIMNAVTIPGMPLMGYLSDHVPVRIVVVVNCIVACLACTLLWGLGTSDPPLVAFSVLWGLTSGSASGFWSKLITIIARGNTAVPLIALTIFSVLKGIGALATGPITTALLNFQPIKGAPGAYGSTSYGAMFIYTGTMMAAAGLPALLFPAS